jgi:hypothetical protein
MSRVIISKVAVPFLVVVVCAILPVASWAKHGGGSRWGGGSRGGGFHGGGSHWGSGSHGGASHGGIFHGGGGHGSGNSSFFGGGKSKPQGRGQGRSSFFDRGNFPGGSRGKSPPFSNAYMGRGGNNNFRMGGGHYGRTDRRAGNDWARSSGNFGNFPRNSNFQGGRFSDRGSVNDSGSPSGSHAVIQNPRNSGTGGWNLGRRSVSHSRAASTRGWANSPRGGWHSLGNSDRGGGIRTSRGESGDVRPARGDGQWHSFGNRENNRGEAYFAEFSRRGRDESAWNVARDEFRRNRFSENGLRGGRFSSFSSDRVAGDFGRASFGQAGFSGSRLESSLGGRGSGGSFIGSGLSIIPNLFGGLLSLGGLGTSLGTSLLGGRLLGGPAVSLAANLIGTGLNAAIGSGQSSFSGEYSGENAGSYPGGPTWRISVQSAPGFSPCGASMYGRPDFGWGSSCYPYSGYRYGWSGTANFGGSGNGFYFGGDDSRNYGDDGNGN